MLLKKDFSNVSFPMFNSLDSNDANDLQKQEGRAGLSYQNAIATRASNGKI